MSFKKILNQYSKDGNYIDTISCYHLNKNLLDIKSINMILGILSNNIPQDKSNIVIDLIDELLIRVDLNNVSYECLLKLACRLKKKNYILNILNILNNQRIILKLRGYSDIIKFYTDSNLLSNAWDLYDHIKYKVELTEKEFNFLINSCENIDSNFINNTISLLNDITEYIYLFENITLDNIENWCLHNNLKTGYVYYDETINIDCINESLEFIQPQSININLEDRNILLSQITDIIKNNYPKQFKKFLLFRSFIHSNPKNIHIDGANIGYYSKRVDKGDKLSFIQIDTILSYFIDNGYDPIIYLHTRHCQTNNYHLNKWRNNNYLWETPIGINDDLFWLYASIYNNNSFVISNDLMRDHHFSLLSQRRFLTWNNRHQIHFDFEYNNTQSKRYQESNSVKIIYPTKISYRNQYDKKNNIWLLPKQNKKDWLYIRIT